MNLRRAVSTFRGHREPHVDFIGKTWYWFALSGFFVLLSLVGLFARGLNYSIDFKGGAQLRYPNEKNVSARQITGILGQYGRSDAEVQVVGASSGPQIVIRTRSLNDLGGPPQTKYTVQNTKGATVDQLKEALAEVGLFDPRIKLTGDQVTVVIQRVSDVVGKSHDVTLVYHPAKDVSAKDVEGTLASVGRANAQVTVLAGTVVIRTSPLTATAPTPAPTPSAPGTSATPTTSTSGAATPTPSASSASPSAAATPSPAASPAATRAQILDALAKQAGIQPTAIAANDLSKDTPADVVAALADRAGVDPSQVTEKALGGDERARLLNQLAAQAGTTTSEIVINDVGPTWGSQISKKAVQGLIIFLVLVTLYIAFRFEWKMAGSALTALGHDLIITAGIYALVGREVTPETVIAILTILGYSLYDTVVIFDRVKENTESLALVARDTYSGVVNLSLNETLMRSVNTSLVVLLPILALLLFGGSTLKDFAFALFIGVASGAYSSIFVASPMLALLKEREPRYAQIRLRAARAAAGGRGAVPVTAGARARRPVAGKSAVATADRGDGATGDGAAGDGATGAPGAPAATARPAQAKPRAGSGARPSGARSGGGGGKSKSKKRTPAAKRRRR
ncbi:MAG: protein translocase subunit SecF [Actinomycetota bacterium]